MRYCEFNIHLKFYGGYLDVLNAWMFIRSWIKVSIDESRYIAQSKKYSWQSPILRNPRQGDYNIKDDDFSASGEFYWTGYYNRFGLYEEEIRRISEVLPEVSFLLRVEGSTAVDSWKKRIVDGKSVMCEERRV